MKCCIIKYIVKFLLILNLVFKINAIHPKIKKVSNENEISKLLDIIKYNGLDKYALLDNTFEKLDNLKYKNAQYDTNYENQEGKRGLNARLVKRLVPHGYKSKAYEYDEKFKSIFKPLVRIHSNGHKGRIFVNNAILEDNELSNKIVNPYDNFDTEQRNLKDEYLLQPFKLNTAAKITPENILEDVKQYVRSENDVRKIRALKYAEMDVLENKHNFLRSVLYIPPGKISSRPDKNDLLVPDPAAQWGSQYNYWNYWTYNKPVHEDHCKGKLVQWGNMCIETPTH